MAAALSTVAQIEQLGALTPSLFNLPDQTSLDTLVSAKRSVATAWLQRRTPNFYASTDPQIQALLAEAEALFTLHLLIPILRAQKVYGTHFPYMSEESPNYNELIDTDFRAMAIELLDEFAVTDDRDRPFAAPVFVISQSIDPLDLDSQEAQLDEILVESNALTATPVGSPSFGLTAP